MTNHFLQTLQHLRHYEEVLLYGNLHTASEEQRREAADYLAKEYKNESLHYPYSAPVFDPAAAVWAAATVYTACQLLLYRADKASDLDGLLPAYSAVITPSAMLSADLTLRFVPDIIYQLKAIDPDDGLIAVLEIHLKTWHYSGVNYPLPVTELHFDVVGANNCLQQLYADRIIENKKLSLASHPAMLPGVRASLGLFTAVYWTDFKEEHQL